MRREPYAIRCPGGRVASAVSIDMVASRETGVVDLPRAGVPADHGLASLGLVMQLAGRTSAALAALAASLIALDARPIHATWLFFAIGLCIARSSAHRIAGRDLLYGRRTLDGVADPFDATRTYIAFGVLHAVAIGAIATRALGATATTGAGLAAALALWPIVLAVVLRGPRFRRFQAGIPLGEDRGLESASILMTILGACGALSTGAIVALLGGLSSRHLEHGWGTMIIVVFALLLVRSCLHMRVGITGLRPRCPGSFDRPGELASRYVSFGLITAICVGCVLALLALSSPAPLAAIAAVAMSCWLLAVWPITLKRYVAHRQFAELLAGDRVLHRRAPDAGLTGLGWLLAGHASAAASILVVELTATPRGAGRILDGVLQLTGAARAPADLAVAAIVVGLEALAAAALIRMSDHRRAVATIYALVAGAVALAAAWPVARGLGARSLDVRAVMQWIPVAIQIVIPAATLALVHRVAVPAARARYRLGRERRNRTVRMAGRPTM
jgi:hypothetical protein